MNGKCLLILLSIHFVFIESARILAVFPMPSISHQIVYQPLTHELVRRGHQVTVITPDPAYPKGQTPENLTEIDVHDISYETWVKGYITTKKVINKDYTSKFKFGIRALKDIVMAQVSTREVREIIFKKKGEFDLLFIEYSFKALLGLSHIFDIPVIQISSYGSTSGLLYTPDAIGVSSHPFIYPVVFNQKIYNLTYFDKWEILYSNIQFKKSMEESVESLELVKTIFGSDFSSATELNKNVHMHFRNNHRFWIDNQPASSNLVYIGGIHIPSPKPLPQNLQSYLDNAQNGVIYMSLGTNTRMSLLQAEKVQIFFEVFSEVPYNILLKWDTDTLPGIPENIRVSKWFPQSDLLHHPNIKLFITQGGLQSTDEAIHAGVPLIGIPTFADQSYNTEKYIYHKIGKKLDLLTFTKEQLREAIDTVIGEKSYRENIKRLRSLIEDQPTTALERAVWWTEHVLRRDGEHFYAGEANVSWTEYIELELMLIVLSVVLCGITLLSYIIYYSYQCITQQYFYNSSKAKQGKIF